MSAVKERTGSGSRDVKTEVTVKQEPRPSRGGEHNRSNSRGGEEMRSNSRGGDDMRSNSRGGDDIRNNSRGGDDVRSSGRNSDDGRGSGHGSSGHGNGVDSKTPKVEKKEGGSHSDRKAEKEKRESLKKGKERGSPMLNSRCVSFRVPLSHHRIPHS